MDIFTKTYLNIIKEDTDIKITNLTWNEDENEFYAKLEKQQEEWECVDWHAELYGMIQEDDDGNDILSWGVTTAVGDMNTYNEDCEMIKIDGKTEGIIKLDGRDEKQIANELMKKFIIEFKKLNYEDYGKLQGWDMSPSPSPEVVQQVTNDIKELNDQFSAWEQYKDKPGDSLWRRFMNALGRQMSS